MKFSVVICSVLVSVGFQCSFVQGEADDFSIFFGTYCDLRVGPSCPAPFECIARQCGCPGKMQLFQDGKCRGLSGSECDGVANWCVDGAECVCGSCKCKSDRIEDINSGVCLKTTGANCTVNLECATETGFDCMTDPMKPDVQTCTCARFGIPGPCYKTNGSSCMGDEECTVRGGNLVCRNGVCNCRYGEIFNPNFGKVVPPSSLPAIGRCEVPFGKRCRHMSYPPADVFCAGSHCGAVSNHCECVNGKYDTTKMVCECNPSFVFNEHSGMCECPYGQFIQPPDNLCACPVPMKWNNATRACEHSS